MRGQWEIVNRLFDQVSGSLTSADCTLLADRGLALFECDQDLPKDEVA